MSLPVIVLGLKPYDETRVAWVYGRFERLCAADGMRQVWIYLPPLFPTRGAPEERGRARELAEAAGFEIIDLTGAFDGIAVDTLDLEEWDRHPNARAHEIIAGRRYECLPARPASFSPPARSEKRRLGKEGVRTTRKSEEPS